MPEALLACFLCLVGHRVHVDWRTLAVVHAGAAAFDGASTLGRPEANPLVRPLIGSPPSPGRMAAWGGLEVAGAAWLARRHPRLRWLQVALAVAHVEGGVYNTRKR